MDEGARELRVPMCFLKVTEFRWVGKEVNQRLVVRDLGVEVKKEI